MGPRLGYHFLASWGRSGKQQQEQNAANLRPTFQPSPVYDIKWLPHSAFSLRPPRSHTLHPNLYESIPNEANLISKTPGSCMSEYILNNWTNWLRMNVVQLLLNSSDWVLLIQNVRKYAWMCRKNVLSYAESNKRWHAYDRTCIKRRGCMFRRQLALLFCHPLLSP